MRIHNNQRVRAWRLGVSLAACLIPVSGFTKDFFFSDVGPIRGQLDLELAYGLQLRTEDRDPGLIGEDKGGDSFSPNVDDGNLNYDDGNLAIDQTHKFRAWLSWDFVSTSRWNLNASWLENFYSGSPYLGNLGGSLPPGEGGLNPNAGFSYMWHSHNERELVNNDVFPGGMMTMLIIEAPLVPISE